MTDYMQQHSDEYESEILCFPFLRNLKWKILVYIENKLYSFEIAFHIEVSFQAVWIILSHNTTIATFITGAGQLMHKFP